MAKRKRDADAGPSSNTRARRLIKTEPDELLLNPKIEDAPSPRRNPSRGAKRFKSEKADDQNLGPTPRTVKREPSATTDVLQDSEDEVISPRAARRRQLAVMRSESEVGEDAEDPKTPIPRRLRRGRSEEEEDEKGDVPAGENDLDSDTDSANVDDLDRMSTSRYPMPTYTFTVPTPPSPSKPTAKELRSAALQRYTKTRNTKPSPTSARKNIVEAAEASAKTRKAKSSPTSAPVEDGAETSSVPDSEEDVDSTETDGSDMGTEEDLDKSDASLIDDEDHAADEVLEVEEALGPERYARRNIDGQLAVFVEYIVRLHYEPNLLSLTTTTEDDTAITALRRHMDGYANSMLLSTWSGPFTAMLQQRPVLIGPISCETDDCQACWTRGPYACSVSGSCTLTTRKGFYDRDGDTFQDIPERKIEYDKETTCDFPNSAVAPKLLYPPGFRLVVGARCSHRAVAYHQARHYMYSISTRVRDEIESLCDQDDDLVGDKDSLLKALEEEEFVTELLNDFKADQKHWKEFQYRFGGT
ncbi:hypothetical protein B0H17DRAFT_1207159 [Mycena rosella]|uniref:DUF4211 domain-containing protein n=1 Tax=Mycena rosella TaxID=1033263 RepID=A0AAD7D3D9_MYCRO|nr:hypothetical protein B0H17DRAFT_1207159 [Mycena rosella]